MLAVQHLKILEYQMCDACNQLLSLKKRIPRVKVMLKYIRQDIDNKGRIQISFN